ncbi:hypothetical protein BP5796_12441 [Coleophoma crateriformis]|uniref:Xylanolytic transcriptional activator regulatory domain-containing protein n=1 Tax=Coleophoma crateriformis TaxID=565419 RepID=A0A3D8Q9Q0_9HELO|nr:hypothetical protein BP5796_12441 [Coleophoma crateriformis]
MRNVFPVGPYFPTSPGFSTDPLFPGLSTGRSCVYDVAAPQLSSIDSDHPSAHVYGPGHGAPSISSQSSGTALGVSASAGLIDLTAGTDPFRHESIRKPTVNAIAQKELLRIVGSPNNMRQVASSYFAAISCRIPIVSAKRFLERLPSTVFADCDADFAALCLCIYLILEVPQPGDVSMQSSLYVKVKGILSLLEATSYHSLEAVQSRILVAFYEMGHGLYPAAAASIGACGKMARFIGLHSNSTFRNPKGKAWEILAEEKRRTLWALHNLDRYLNLCTQESLFVTPFPQGTDPLPIEESCWTQDIALCPVVHTLNTPSDVSIASFARECQICHLVGRVQRNVYDPTPDASFQAQEAEQLEVTMLAFIPLLRQDGEEFGKYCISFAICSSAIYTLYAASLESDKYDPGTMARRYTLLEETSLELTRYCRRLFEVEEEINYGLLSPFVPYALYQSAVVQLRFANQNLITTYAENVAFLKQVLGYFTKRWLVAARYLRELEGDSPPLLLTIT